MKRQIIKDALFVVGHLETSVDDEINQAIGIGVDPSVQSALEEMKMKLIANQPTEGIETNSNIELDKEIEAMKKELEE